MMIVPELWSEAGRRPRLLASSVLLQLLVFAMHLVQATALAGAFAAFAGGEEGAVMAAIGVVLGICLVRVGLDIAQGAVSARLGGRVRETLRARTVAAVLVPRRLHDPALRDGSTSLALGDGVDGTDAYVSRYIPAAVQVVVGSAAVVAILIPLSPVTAGAVAAAVVLAVVGPMIWKRLLARHGFSHWDSYETLSGDTLEALRGMSTLRALGDVPSTRARLGARSEALRRATERVMRTSLADTAITDLAVQAGVVLAAGLAVVEIMTGQASAVEVYLILLLSSEAFRPVRELSRQWHAGFLGLTAIPGLRALGAFDAPEPIRAAADAPDGSREATRLTISGLGFRYPDAVEPVLVDVDLRAERGRVHAIVGPSGSGKSTLFDVLLGFLPPSSGTIELDGRPLRAEDIAVVSQRPVLFAATVRDNIDLFGAGDDALEEACASAGVLAEIRALPLGFDTMVAEAGASLSGGQRQRLALARALLARRPVLLVDEPTSALDQHSADIVSETLEHVSRERIVLMISHRREELRRVTDVHALVDGALVQVAS